MAVVVDEYLAARVVFGTWPEGLPDDDDIVLTASRHWRLLQRIHSPAVGQLSAIGLRIPAALLCVSLAAGCRAPTPPPGTTTTDRQAIVDSLDQMAKSAGVTLDAPEIDTTSAPCDTYGKDRNVARRAEMGLTASFDASQNPKDVLRRVTTALKQLSVPTLAGGEVTDTVEEGSAVRLDKDDFQIMASYGGLPGVLAINATGACRD